MQRRKLLEYPVFKQGCDREHRRARFERDAFALLPRPDADSGRSGALIPFEVGQHSAAMWGRIPLGSGALFGL